MTKKHFEAIARVLGETNAEFMTVAKLASEFQEFNPRFRRDQFHKAVDANRPINNRSELLRRIK